MTVNQREKPAGRSQRGFEKASHVVTPISSANVSGRRVLVTGAPGFIGSHLVPALVDAGARVTTASLVAETEAGASHVTVDLRDAGACDRLLEALQPEFIYHLAASRDRTADLAALRSISETNLFVTANLFGAASNVSALRTIVVLGTAEEYGDNVPPYTETIREAPISIYSLSKVFSTHVAQFMNRVHHVPCVVIRPSVVYGPGQARDMFLPALIGTIAAGRPFEMTRGEQTRDFIFVSDLIDALTRASVCRSGELLNISSGVPIRIVDLALKVGRLLGREDLIRVGALDYRPADMMDYAVDSTLARQTLSWAPRVSIDAGLAMTVPAYS
ncbi:MAG: NAD-dependent epimerase/dehydratase family protein [Acidobacteria bacterium]|nr:NAD-dependent epimerase/dehydratase family protein [Acidobacteriota bacterium]